MYLIFNGFDSNKINYNNMYTKQLSTQIIYGNYQQFPVVLKHLIAKCELNIGSIGTIKINNQVNCQFLCPFWKTECYTLWFAISKTQLTALVFFKLLHVLICLLFSQFGLEHELICIDIHYVFYYPSLLQGRLLYLTNAEVVSSL